MNILYYAVNTVLVSMVLCSCASYPFQGWSTADTVRQGAMISLDVVDWAQTNEIVSNDDFYERQNPFLKKNENHRTVNLYFPAIILTKAIISGSLKPGPWREGFQLLSIGASAWTTVNNRKIGVKP